MKIAFIGQKKIPAFQEEIEHVENLAKRFAEMGHEVFVYASFKNQNDFEENDGVRIMRSSGILSATLQTLFSEYDIIHYQEPTLFSIIPAFLKTKTAVITTLYSKNNLPDCISSLKEKIACKFSDKVIVVSRKLRNYIFSKYKIKSAYIPNGSQIKNNQKTNALDRWNLKKGKYILSIIKEKKSKGIKYLIESFKNIENTNKIPNGFKLVIIIDGIQEKDFLKELYILRETRNNIIFTENQTRSALEQLFSHAYLFVQPSESERFSTELLEAMTYGTAALASDTAENIETIGKCGFSFHSRSQEDLEEKLAYLLNSPKMVEKRGKQAKERVVKNYSWDSIARKTLKIYETSQKNPARSTFRKIQAENKYYA